MDLEWCYRGFISASQRASKGRLGGLHQLHNDILWILCLNDPGKILSREKRDIVTSPQVDPYPPSFTVVSCNRDVATHEVLS